MTGARSSLEAIGQPAVPEPAIEAERCVLAVLVADAGGSIRILFRILVEEILSAHDQRQGVPDGVSDLGVEYVIPTVVLPTVLVVVPAVVIAHPCKQPQRPPGLRPGETPAGLGQAFLKLPYTRLVEGIGIESLYFRLVVVEREAQVRLAAKQIRLIGRHDVETRGLGVEIVGEETEAL